MKPDTHDPNPAEPAAGPDPEPPPDAAERLGLGSARAETLLARYFNFS